MGILQDILDKQSFLFGNRPCLADFGFFASMFRHFSIDPTPARIMRNTAPNVYEWVARMWNLDYKKFDNCDLSMPYNTDLFELICTDYLSYLGQNNSAYSQGVGKFDCNLISVIYRRVPTVYSRVMCLDWLRAHYYVLTREEKEILMLKFPYTDALKRPYLDVLKCIPLTNAYLLYNKAAPMDISWCKYTDLYLNGQTWDITRSKL